MTKVIAHLNQILKNELTAICADIFLTEDVKVML